MTPSVAAKQVVGPKYWQALNQAFVEEMERDERTVLVGEDVGAPGGPYGVTRGLQKQFGSDRVRDTPISETTIVGLGIGAAAQGLRPIVELMFLDFAMLAMDQIVNQAAKFRWFTAGRSLPLTITTMCGAGGHNGAQHSQSIETWFCQVPGLKVVMPSEPADAKGLLKSAIRDEDPTLFIETQGLLAVRGPVPDGEYLVPLGAAAVKRAGSDVTVVASGRIVARALEAADTLVPSGISAEVIDPRTLQPLDTETILDSVRRTGGLVVAHEAMTRFGWGAELCALAAEHCFEQLRAPPQRLGSSFTPVPTPVPLAEGRVPSAAAIVSAVKRIVG